jgi:hypothetical protein
MSLHDLFTQAGRDRARRRFRLRLARRRLGLPGLPGRPWRGPGCSTRATARRRRRLAAIDRALATETPRLASMFAMFNQLVGGEPVAAERLPSRTWPRPRLVQVAFLATLAAIVALSVVLTTKVHSVMRPCPTSMSEISGASPPASSSSASASSLSSGSPLASSSSSAASASPFASSSGPPSAGQAGGATGLAAFVPVRGLSCQAYAAPNK